MLVVYSKLTSKLVAAVCFSQFLISSLTCARLDRVFARGIFTKRMKQRDWIRAGFFEAGVADAKVCGA